jgi:DNA polymerase-4
LDARLLGLVERVCRRLRAAHRVCRTVVLRLRFHDFSRASRSHTLPGPTSDTAAILLALRHLLWESTGVICDRGITLIGVSLSNLADDGALQLELPLGRPRPGLDGAVDRVRERYGSSALVRGVLLGSDPGLTVPLLPD